MINFRLIIPMVLLCVSAAGCSYRFVDPFPASDYSLVLVRNSTAEAGLAAILEEELRRFGGFKKSSSNHLSVTITSFTERVESIGSSGTPVRQALVMEIAWKVEGKQAAQATFGSLTVDRSYPYSSDLSTLDWNRNAAIRLLSEMAARKVLDSLETGR